MASTNILVVEDEPIIALDIKRRLASQGYQVETVDGAEAALDAVTQSAPDLILMDICLGGEVDGIEAAAQIRSRANLPIVYLTAHTDKATLERAKSTQPFGYIIKPFETHNLSMAIEIALSRHRAELAIQEALLREKELKDLKSRFVSIVSHEFRNPLSTIQFSLDLLERHDDTLAAEKKQLYLQRARTSVNLMNQLLEEILVLGGAEAGKLSCQPIPMDLPAFCQELVEEFQTVTQTAHSLMFTVSGDVAANPCPHWFDDKLLRHILTNLLSNACKYSPQDSEIRFDLIWRPNRVCFRVQDHGIGVPGSDCARLFEPFHRGTNVSDIPGTGLGLSIVKQCVEAHAGTIAIESEIAVGTVFTVTLPSQPASRLPNLEDSAPDVGSQTD